MGKRPRIGITMRLELETGRFYLGRDYGEAVERCGGVPVHIALIPKAEYIADVVADLDGVLLPGSNTDVDPALYGEEPKPRLGTVIPVKDETDLLVIEQVDRMNIPLLGICYGMQVLNVFRGGTVIQDIGSEVDAGLKHDQGKPYDRASHGLTVEEGSHLSMLRSVKGMIRVNSSHHQAVRSVGENLRAAAWASDGIIECIEDTRSDRFALGVQWHPELTYERDDLSREIFELFVNKCAERRENK